MKTPRLRRPRRSPRRRRRGLTLIEILVVVTILGIISSVIGINLMSQMEKARVDTTGIQMKNIGDALELYRMRFAKYPTTAEGLHALSAPPGSVGPIMAQIPRDAWDHEFVYVYPGQHGARGFDLSSLGSDGVGGTDDDVRSWSDGHAAQ